MKKLLDLKILIPAAVVLVGLIVFGATAMTGSDTVEVSDHGHSHGHGHSH